MMNMNCIILHAVDVTAGNGGMEIEYVICDRLEPVDGGAEKGYGVMHGVVPMDAMPSIETVPGVYNIRFAIHPDGDRQPTLRPVSLQYVGTIR